MVRLVVLDTNVFVAAGFSRRSRSREILERIRAGSVRLVVDGPTRRETERVLAKIPPLDPADFHDVLDAAEAPPVGAESHGFEIVPDPTDRKFAALAKAAGAILVTNDSDLLSVRDALPVVVMTPGEFVRSDDAG